MLPGGLLIDISNARPRYTYAKKQEEPLGADAFIVYFRVSTFSAPFGFLPEIPAAAFCRLHRCALVPPLVQRLIETENAISAVGERWAGIVPAKAAAL